MLGEGRMKEKHVPMRMCCICRIRAPKHSLIRHVVSADGQLIADFAYRAPGRGLYACKEFRCQEAMTRRSATKKKGAVNR